MWTYFHKSRSFDQFQGVQGDGTIKHWRNWGSDELRFMGKLISESKLSNGKFVTLKNASYTPEATANIFAVRGAFAQLGDESEHWERIRSSQLIDGAGDVILTAHIVVDCTTWICIGIRIFVR